MCWGYVERGEREERWERIRKREVNGEVGREGGRNAKKWTK